MTSRSRHQPHSFPALLLPWTLFLLALVIVPLMAQTPLAETPPSDDLSPYELVVLKTEVGDAWVEVTSLAGESEPVAFWLGDLEPDDDDPYLTLPLDVDPGPVQVCSGAGGLAGVFCVTDHLAGEEDGAYVLGVPLDAVGVEFVRGVLIVGQYTLGDFVVPGALVAVVPADLESARPFTLPLAAERRGRSSVSTRREVLTSSEGRFVIPPLAPGVYFLETLLPTGRIHRSESFVVDFAEALGETPRPALGRSRPAETSSRLPSQDLGILDVAEGLTLEVRVAGPAGEPLLGAAVSARQGRTADELVTYQAVTGASGIVRLSGFSTDYPATVSCQAPGHRAWRKEFELVPVVILCDLEPLAQVFGQVVGPGGTPVAGATATLVPRLRPGGEPAGDGGRDLTGSAEAETLARELGTPLDGSPPLSRRSQSLDFGGRFGFADIVAGGYDLFVAAPGHEVLEHEIELVPGQRLDLGSLTLLAGREVLLRVVDASDGAPIQGARIQSTNPPGAVDGFTDADGELVFATRRNQPIRLRVEADEYARAYLSLTPEILDDDEPVTVALDHPGWIVARVWDETLDLACAGCPLLIRPGEVEILTDGLGEAYSPALAPGTYRVYRPRLDHLGSTVIEQTDAEMRWVRVERGRIAVVTFGERREGIRVSFSPPVPADWSLVTRGSGHEARYHREQDGGFVVRQRPGEVLELWLRHVDPEVGREVEVAQGFLLPDSGGRRSRITLPRPDTSVEGRAQHPNGSPIARVAVRLFTLDHRHRATAWTHDDGTFRLDHPEPGVYALYIGQRNVKFISLSPGLDLDTGSFQLTLGSY